MGLTGGPAKADTVSEHSMSAKFLAASCVVVASALVLAAPATAQTLGDVAKKESERRQGVKPAGKVITNTDLPNVPPPTAAPPADTASTASSGDVGKDAKAADAKDAKMAGKDGKDTGKDAKDSGDSNKKDQKYWAGRMKDLKDEQQRDKMFADSLQSRINALTTDFVNRDDPYQRAQIGKDRDAAVKELDRVKKAIVDRTKAIGDLEEEARRAGAPAGWLR